MISPLSNNFDLIFLDSSKGMDKLLEQLKVEIVDVEYLIPLLSVPITRDILESAKNLKCIAQYAVGYNK